MRNDVIPYAKQCSTTFLSRVLIRFYLAILAHEKILVSRAGAASRTSTGYWMFPSPNLDPCASFYSRYRVIFQSLLDGRLFRCLRASYRYSQLTCEAIHGICRKLQCKLPPIEHFLFQLLTTAEWQSTLLLSTLACIYALLPLTT